MNISDGHDAVDVLVALKRLPRRAVNGGAFARHASLSRRARSWRRSIPRRSAARPTWCSASSTWSSRRWRRPFPSACPPRPSAPPCRHRVGRPPRDRRHLRRVYPYPGGYAPAASPTGSSMARRPARWRSSCRWRCRSTAIRSASSTTPSARARAAPGCIAAAAARPTPSRRSRLRRVDPRRPGRPSPPGIEGGGPAAPTTCACASPARSGCRPSLEGRAGAAQGGDTVCLASPGGGGYGDPLARDLALVEQT